MLTTTRHRNTLPPSHALPSLPSFRRALKASVCLLTFIVFACDDGSADIAGPDDSSTQTETATSDPGTVTDLAASTASESSVTLSWTEVDDGTGSAADYAIRRGSPSISWGDAAASQMLVSGTGIDQTATYEWTGLAAGADHQFQLVPYRGTLEGDVAFGGLSNVASATTASEELESDTIITVAPDPVRLYGAGDAATLTVTAETSGGEPVEGLNFEFSSADTTITKVDSMGQVTAQAIGTAMITVFSGLCACGDSTTVEVNGDGGELPVGVTLNSRWETALGTSENALLDGGVWDDLTCSTPENVLEVVDGADHGLPGYNALQVKSRGENCGAVIKNAIAERAQSVYGRMYLMNQATAGHSWNHPIAHDYIGDIEATFSIWPQSGGGWQLKFSNGGTHDATDKDNWFVSDDNGSTRYEFTNGEWIRFEYFVDIQNSDGDYKFYPRIYNDQGTLIFDENDFWHVDSGTQLSAMNEQGNFTMNPSSTDGAEEFREFGIGSEGPLNHPDDGESYFAALVAFSTEAWIGGQDGPF